MRALRLPVISTPWSRLYFTEQAPEKSRAGIERPFAACKEIRFMAAATGNVLCRKVYSSSVLCARSVSPSFRRLGAGFTSRSRRRRNLKPASSIRLPPAKKYASWQPQPKKLLCRKVYSSSVPCARSVSPSFRRLGAGSTSRSRRRRNLKSASSARLPPAKKLASWQRRRERALP